MSNYPIEYALQETPLGTGNAVLSTLDLLNNTDINLIVNGDNPLLKYNTLKNILDTFQNQNKQSKLQVTAIDSKNPFGCGRIIISNNKFDKIVEEKDCNIEEKKITIVNCGIYLAYGDVLKKYIPQIKNNNVQKEYYLTDLIEIYNNSGNCVSLHILDSSKDLEMVNINTKDQLIALNDIIKL